jgi:hypothetical protein
MDRPGTWEIPSSSCAEPERSTAHKRTRLARSVSAARERTAGQHTRPERESISAREPAAGSRSAFMVPVTSENSAREDPIEGRGASRVQTRAWETRRAL